MYAESSTPQCLRPAKNTLAAVKSFGHKAIVIYPCSDPGYEGVIKAIEEVSSDNQFAVYKNIDNLEFLSLMSEAQVLVGNSSCAIVEAPYFQLAAINIGNRQLDRDREANVVDSSTSFEDIKDKISYVFSNDAFKQRLSKTGSRLGDGRASQKVLDILNQ